LTWEHVVKLLNPSLITNQGNNMIETLEMKVIKYSTLRPVLAEIECRERMDEKLYETVTYGDAAYTLVDAGTVMHLLGEIVGEGADTEQMKVLNRLIGKFEDPNLYLAIEG
jgi:hypothetical protein